ncbi:MAG: peptidoglycan editing factor PgeF [Cyanobacteria bacterium P01_A01_bin.84]
MHTWKWHKWEGLPYLTCSLLEPLSHGFFTQQFLSHSPLELSQVIEHDAKAYRLKQVHGNVVLTSQEIENKLSQGGKDVEREGDSALVQGDGIVSTHPLESVWVASADCTPVLIADRVTGQVSAVHAGWRGTSKKIVPVAIAHLQEMGSQMQNLLIAMGPAISGEVYQVSTDVAAEIGASIVPESEEQAILNTLGEIPDSPLLSDPEPGKVRIDVRRVNALQMEQMGISPEQIAIAPYCTYQTPEYFFSYRREKLKKIQWSGIVSTSPKS